MTSSWLLENLRCPLTGTNLSQLTPETLGEINEQIERGEIFSRLGVRATERLQEALSSQDQRWIYPICNGIPQMMIDEALVWRKAEATVIMDAPISKPSNQL